MKDLNSEPWKSVFEPDQRSLLNIRIYGTDRSDDEKFLGFVKSRYTISYSENGLNKTLPKYEEITKRREFCSVRLSIDVDGIALNSFFWDVNEINIDLLPEDVDSLAKAESVFELMRALAAHLKKSVLLTGENASATRECSKNHAICTVDPLTNELSFRLG